MPRIRIEFFGIPRQRAGVAEAVFDIDDGEEIELRRVFRKLTKQYPQLEDVCLADGNLARGYVANIDGKQFVADSKTTVRSESTIIIMSADAGG